MREKFEDVKVEIIAFDLEDVITTSSTGDDGPGDWGEIDP